MVPLRSVTYTLNSTWAKVAEWEREIERQRVKLDLNDNDDDDDDGDDDDDDDNNNDDGSSNLFWQGKPTHPQVKRHRIRESRTKANLFWNETLRLKVSSTEIQGQENLVHVACWLFEFIDLLFPHPAPVKVESVDFDDDDSLPLNSAGLDPDMWSYPGHLTLAKAVAFIRHIRLAQASATKHKWAK